MDMALLLICHPVVLLVTAGTQALTGKAMAQLSVLQRILESNPLYYFLLQLDFIWQTEMWLLGLSFILLIWQSENFEFN